MEQPGLAAHHQLRARRLAARHPDGGFRATKEGADALGEHPDPQSLYEASNLAYRDWDALRKAPLTPAPVDPTAEVVHDGTGSPTHGSPPQPVLDGVAGR